MGKWKIEKVPLAQEEAVERRGRRAVYPWGQMEIGESIFIDGDKEGRAALNAAYQYARRGVSSVWRFKDGRILRVPAAMPLLKILEVCVDGDWKIVGQKKFSGRRERTGWRIGRIADIPLDQLKTFTSPEAPGFRFLEYPE